MTMAKWILAAAFVLAWTHLSSAEYCITASGRGGYCVNIKRCDHLYGLLKNRPVPPTVFDTLKKAQCGFEGLDPKVCCMIASGPITVAKTTTTTTTTTPSPFTQDISLEDHPSRKLLPDDLCGPMSEDRIYGGNTTTLYEFPWMALLAYDFGFEIPQFRCGGSLINKRYVITAAHCTTALPDTMKLVSVRIGEYDLSTERDCDEFESGEGFNCAASYQEFGIERVHVHPEYVKETLHNDVALVRLNGEADVEPPNVRPICLPLGTASVLKAPRVIVTGWGSTPVGFRSDKLLKISIALVGNAKCEAAYRRRLHMWEKQICAGGARGVDSCAGDSGGPLQAIALYEGSPRMVLYGIVSYGARTCGLRGYPGVYTNVVYYVRWILDQITE